MSLIMIPSPAFESCYHQIKPMSVSIMRPRYHIRCNSFHFMNYDCIHGIHVNFPKIKNYLRLKSNIIKKLSQIEIHREKYNRVMLTRQETIHPSQENQQVFSTATVEPVVRTELAQRLQEIFHRHMKLFSISLQIQVQISTHCVLIVTVNILQQFLSKVLFVFMCPQVSTLLSYEEQQSLHFYFASWYQAICSSSPIRLHFYRKIRF